MAGAGRPLALQLPEVFEDARAMACYAAQHKSPEQELRLLLERPPEERSSSLALFHAAQLSFKMQVKGKCGSCMFQRQYCICGALAELRRKAVEYQVGDRVRFVVWMHQLERPRASNTGKLLEHVLPGSEVLLHDVPTDTQRLDDLVAMVRGRAVVLYPSEDATPAAEAHALMAAPAGEGVQPPLLAVLVDGTWRQAKRMHRVFEGLPHVALSHCGSSEFHWRRQSQEGRISTVEAAALLLEELGEAPEGAPALLRRSLQELNTGLERQCHYDKFVEGPAPPEPSARKRAALRNKLPKLGPGCKAPRSSATSEP